MMTMKIILFYLSCFLAFIGGHVTNYSAIIYAQEVFGSDLLSGIGFGLCFGPPLIFGWIAGAYCDRYPPSKIVIASQCLFIVAGGIFLSFEWLALDLVTQRIFFIVATFIIGLAWSFLSPSRLAALAQVVPREKLHIATVIFNMLIMIGFGLAPILLAIFKQWGGWHGIFCAITLLFTVATILLLPIKTRAATLATSNSLYAQVKQGIDSVTSTPILWQLLLSSTLVYALLGPMQVLLPRYGSSILQLDDMALGYFLGTLAVALIAGGLLCMIFTKTIHHGKAILIGPLLGATALYSISLSSDIDLATLSLLVCGFSGGFIASLIVAGLQHHTPDHLRGRVMSIYTMTSQVMPALSGLWAGAFSQYLGVLTALQLSSAIVIVGLVITTIKSKEMKRFEGT